MQKKLAQKAQKTRELSLAELKEQRTELLPDRIEMRWGRFRNRSKAVAFNVFIADF